MEYFYAKLGRGNCLATEYLAGKTPIGQPAVPIFFNGVPSNRAEFEKDGKAKEQGANFFWCADNPGDSTVVIIHQGKIYLARPNGPVVFQQHPEDTRHLEAGEYHKFLPIEIDEGLTKHLAEVPPILASMTANTYYYTGTFRKIGDRGNRRALQTLQDLPLDPLDPNQPEELLGCLSSIELETLIAKLFEEVGCHVPAYRGGAIKDIDIFANNLGPTKLSIGPIEIAARESVSIQVKRHSTMKARPPGCKHLISITNDAHWLLDVIRGKKLTRQWLARSLGWLPKYVLADYGLS